MKQDEIELAATISSFTHDPLGYVMFSFPWGKEGTDLARSSGPRRWQREFLESLSSKLKSGEMNSWQAIQEAVASGHGVGKSAIVAMLIMWAVSTHEDARGIVTANTERQLRTKTWPELVKWHRMAVNTHWFTMEESSIYSSDPNHRKTWRFDLAPWSENNTEAFAGLHNQGKRLVIIFDEASSISDKVWEVAQGALTDAGTEMMFLVFGNPTQSSGRFRDCFGKYKHRWHATHVDSRDVDGATNLEQIKQWIEDYGEDSDYVRVRVRGLFPRESLSSLLSPEEVSAAQRRQLATADYEHAQMRFGVDVARFGEDSTSIFPRQGLRAYPPIEMRGARTNEIASRVLLESQAHSSPTIFVDDTGGYGAGVVDSLIILGASPIGVNFSSKPDDPQFFNRRSEMWWRMAQWVKRGGSLPKDEVLAEELVSVTYSFQSGKLRLEEKDQVKARIGHSPDRADALALSFSVIEMPAVAASIAASPDDYLRAHGLHLPVAEAPSVRGEYDPFEESRL